MVTRPLKKTILGCESGKRFSERFSSQRGRNKIGNSKLSKINYLRKEKTGPRILSKVYSSWGNSRAILVNMYIIRHPQCSWAIMINIMIIIFTLCFPTCNLALYTFSKGGCKLSKNIYFLVFQKRNASPLMRSMIHYISCLFFHLKKIFFHCTLHLKGIQH